MILLTIKGSSFRGLLRLMHGVESTFISDTRHKLQTFFCEITVHVRCYGVEVEIPLATDARHQPCEAQVKISDKRWKWRVHLPQMRGIKLCEAQVNMRYK